MTLEFVRCSHDEHADAILEILNESIVNSTALYDYKPRETASMVAWFRSKELGDYPVIGIKSAEGILGFGSYGVFRSWPAYKYSVEHSVYVRDGHRGRGLGERLLRQLIECAETQGYHVMVGGIDATNEASIRLHEKLGFTHAGTIRQVGFKFGRWLDLALYELILKTPTHPFEG